MNEDVFSNASLEELKKGYKEETDAFVCLLCGEVIEKGIIYPYQEMLYEAERYMKLHIERNHQSVFAYLIGLDKKITGLTEHQSNLLGLFYQGKSDVEVQKELEIGSASTIRHHRFVLKEKERQAKTFLALMELLKEKDNHAPSFIPVHKTAKMVDDRYNITEEEQEKTVRKYFEDQQEARLKKFPLKEKQRLIILREIIKHIDNDKTYSEKALNDILKPIYEDYVLIRRLLIEYGFIDRKDDGSEYWVKK
ncbi:DUF2087 domain-containing protein [Niallia taxi]|uniref:DUF2087 domain-containing protein n=1 Tax=Niallia taxi TaxID=2499688 RepID=A0A3S2TTR2_9BACI|nr:DUF2087 domain-containing protein [Niallia taxi]MED4054099.1 DUF2087 domain-containing protein [Niallia taxi]MED4118380.1 DUF2087 domain-containing protein [Niallia taxi]RVT61593.1 DUF2087 domain-containing protein [Niallia taxi]